VGRLRFASRTLGRNPGFAFAAIAPIALGIGVNTGIFSILDSVAFQPLPGSRPTELVSVHQDFSGVSRRRVHGARSMFSMPEYRSYRDGVRTLSGVMAYSRPWAATLGGPSPQEIEGAMVTCNYFDVLRVPPAMGPGFTAANCESMGAPPMIVLSHTFWTRAFAADPEIVGRRSRSGGAWRSRGWRRQASTVSTSPESRSSLRRGWTRSFNRERPLHEDPQMSWLTLVGRRRGGTGIAAVRAELALIARQIRPGSSRGGRRY
jgi:hypothetical protein